jgi:KDO2-lipid IV(A) lauroyltransferase
VKRQRRFALEGRAAALVTPLAALLPRRAALALGRGLGRLWGDLDRRHLAIAADNLRRAFPHWDEARVLRTARGVYAYLGELLLDLLWTSRRSREEILAWIEVEGGEHVEQANAAGRGVLFVTGHFGNWELNAVAHAWRFGPVSVVARPLDNPALDRRLCDARSRSGNQVIYKERALARVMKALRDGQGVAILVDQNVQEEDGIFIEFFGRPAASTTVAAALALKTGCAVIPGCAVPLGGGRYRLRYDPPLRWSATGDRDADIARLTQQIASHLEGWIRERPELWLWLHRRWKTQPAPARSADGDPRSVERAALGNGAP